MNTRTLLLKIAAALVCVAALAAAASPKQVTAARDTRREKDIQRIAQQAAAFQAKHKRPPETLQDVASMGGVALNDPSGQAYEFQLDHYDPELDVIVTACAAFETAASRPIRFRVAGHSYSLNHGIGRNCFSFNIYPSVPGGDHHH